jgi:hypothetical protein
LWASDMGGWEAGWGPQGVAKSLGYIRFRVILCRYLKIQSILTNTYRYNLLPDTVQIHTDTVKQTDNYIQPVF